MAMRRAASTAARAGTGRRALTGVAPVLHFPSGATESKQAQIERNTAVALDMLHSTLGEKPPPHNRKYAQGIADIQKEIESLLAASGSKSEPLQDGVEATTMQVIERVLRHGVWSFHKNSGSQDWDEMEKWLVYTPQDSQAFGKLRKDTENADKYKAFRAQSGGAACVPDFDWAEEYGAAADREIVSEKRKRYDAVAATTFERDEGRITAEIQAYKQPENEKLLDRLVEQLTLFKPFLAKSVIQAKLIERNADGQLSASRFVDWNPDSRDNCELNWDTHISCAKQWYLYDHECDYKRYADVRMRTNEEIIERMERIQSEMASSGGGAGAGEAGDAKIAAMLAEVIKLQTRGGKVEEKEETDEEVDEEAVAAAIAAAEAKRKAEEARYQVSDSAVKSKGLIGLSFVSEATA